MASIHREISIGVAPEAAWDAMRDAGALHTRLVRGFVTDCKREEGARLVTFANGFVARELIVDVDDNRRRIAWAAVGGRLTHHNASTQVLAEGERQCRVVWTADVLPHALAPAITVMVEHGLQAMRQTLEADAAG